MKILLTAINAKYIHTNLALRSIRAYIGQYGFSATLSEYTINQPFDDILASIYLQAPDVVAFSCYLWNISLVRRLCVELKKLLPSLHIWLGGPEVSYNSSSFLRENPAVDLVLIGEGEETFRQLLSSLNEGGNPTDVPGIAYRASGAIYQTNPAKPMDLAAALAYEDLSAVKNKILYFALCGCPFHVLPSASRLGSALFLGTGLQFLRRFAGWGPSGNFG
ncbi:MAG: B12-binding domain-containing radical SAM protein [Hydrogeniiclostridium mannosilyticum]